MPKHPSDDDNVIPLPTSYTDPELLALREIFPGWHINRGQYGTVQAEWKAADAILIRIVVAENAPSLHYKLQVITDAKDSQEPA